MKNKKSMTMNVLVSIIITIITFFILFGFFANLSSSIVTSTQDTECRAFLAMKDSTMIKIAEQFMGKLNQKCKKDEINYLNEDKEKTFEKVADLMDRCWYRYGEGQYDFLSNVNTEGNWCFTCARLDFKSGGDTYAYQEFIDYLKTVKKEYKDEEGNIKQTNLSTYLNLQYSDINNTDDFYSIKSELEELVKNDDPSVQRIAAYLEKEYEYVLDLRLKEIDTTEPLYIVYRYDVPSDDFFSGSTQAFVGMGLSMVAGVVVSEAISTFLSPTKLLAAIGTGGTSIIAISLGKIGVKSIKTLTKIKELMKRIANLRKLSKVAETAEQVVEYGAKVSEIPKFIRLIEKQYPLFAKKYTNMYDDLSKLKKADGTFIENIEDLDDVVKNLENNKEFLDTTFKKAIEVMEDDVIKLKMQEIRLTQQAEYGEEILKLKEYQKEMESLEQLSPEKITNQADKVKYIKYALITSASVLGGAEATKLNFYEYQYVDVMTKEQYYRLCGTEPILN